MNSGPGPTANPARRKQIVDAAREIAAAEGWSAVTVRAIGTRIGCSAPAIYQYFRNKDEVLVALAAFGQGMLAESVERAAASADGPAKRVRAAIGGIWDFALGNRELYAVIYGGDGLAAHGPDLAPEPLVQAVARLAAKRGSTEPAKDFADRLVATLHGFIGLTLSGRFPGGGERARTLCDRVVEDAIRRIGRD
jgi:AcrR family transcriptional regulator